MPLTAAEWLSENSERQELAVMNIPLAMEAYNAYRMKLNGWIKVEDQQPDDRQRVLILSSKNIVFTAVYNKGMNSFDRDTTDSTNMDRMYSFSWSEVTLWQPLPSPPKTEQATS